MGDAVRSAWPVDDSSDSRCGPVKPLPNIQCFEGDVRSVLAQLTSNEARDADTTKLFLCVHGCNQVTRDVIDLAGEAGALWGVLPCCIPEALYLPAEPLRSA